MNEYYDFFSQFAGVNEQDLQQYKDGGKVKKFYNDNAVTSNKADEEELPIIGSDDVELPGILKDPKSRERYKQLKKLKEKEKDKDSDNLIDRLKQWYNPFKNEYPRYYNEVPDYRKEPPRYNNLLFLNDGEFYGELLPLVPPDEETEKIRAKKFEI